MMNPGWGQAVKPEGLESQKAPIKPRMKEMFSINKIENLGINKKKGSFLNRLSLKNYSSVRHLPQPPFGASIGHGILKDQL